MKHDDDGDESLCIMSDLKCITIVFVLISIVSFRSVLIYFSTKINCTCLLDCFFFLVSAISGFVSDVVLDLP